VREEQKAGGGEKEEEGECPQSSCLILGEGEGREKGDSLQVAACGNPLDNEFRRTEAKS